MVSWINSTTNWGDDVFDLMTIEELQEIVPAYVFATRPGFIVGGVEHHTCTRYFGTIKSLKDHFEKLEPYIIVYGCYRRDVRFVLRASAKKLTHDDTPLSTGNNSTNE